MLIIHLDWSFGGLIQLLCVSFLLAGSSSLSYNTPTHTDPSPRLAAKDGRSKRVSVRVCVAVELSECEAEKWWAPQKCEKALTLMSSWSGRPAHLLQVHFVSSLGNNGS